MATQSKTATSKVNKATEKTLVTKAPSWAWLLLTVAAIAFFLAQSMTWLNTTVFNKDTFTDISSQVILTQKNRDVIAATIVDKSLENRPIADRLIGDRATVFVSSLLGSDLSERALNSVLDRTYAYLTSPTRQDIAIDLTTVKTVLSGLIAFAEANGREVAVNADSIPNEIVFVKEDTLPEVAPYIRASAILAPLFWIITIAATVAYIFIAKANRIRRTYEAGFTLIGVCLLALVMGPFIPPVAASFIEAINLRSLAADLTSAFLQPFAWQLQMSIVVLAVVLIIVRLRGGIIAGAAAVYNAVAHYGSAKK
jgi:hypothetical protein